MTKSIAVIFHENEPRGSLPRFAIWHLAEVWRGMGIKVLYLFGARTHVPADAALLHVDLTTVPDDYIELAQRYPVVLNGNVKNIRKSSFSKHRVTPGDGYAGKVIVKSELNYAGEPERKLLGSSLSRLAYRAGCRMPQLRHIRIGPKPYFRSPRDYRIFENPGCVPEDWYRRSDILIEKFVPEIQEGLYCLRSHHFLGQNGACVMRKSIHPIINASSSISREEVPPAPEIVELAKQMRFDFGKFDYVMHEGKAVLLDANKTPGAGKAPAFTLMCREWAKGIHSLIQ
jgi:hypothetical protein